jgi:hypothetical protein
MKEPRVGVVFDADFDVDKHAPPEESGAMAEAFLCETDSCPQTGKSKSL